MGISPRLEKVLENEMTDIPQHVWNNEKTIRHILSELEQENVVRRNLARGIEKVLYSSIPITLEELTFGSSDPGEILFNSLVIAGASYLFEKGDSFLKYIFYRRNKELSPEESKIAVFLDKANGHSIQLREREKERSLGEKLSNVGKSTLRYIQISGFGGVIGNIVGTLNPFELMFVLPVFDYLSQKLGVESPEYTSLLRFYEKEITPISHPSAE